MVSRRNKYNKKTRRTKTKTRRTRRPQKTRKTRKTRRTKTRKTRKTRKTMLKRGMLKRGGYGRASCPFVGKPWTGSGIDNISNHFAPSKYGIRVGGIRPFPGNKTVSLRHGGGFSDFVPQPALNRYRKGAYDIKNVYNRVKGVRLGASPLPFRQDELQT